VVEFDEKVGAIRKVNQAGHGAEVRMRPQRERWRLVQGVVRLVGGLFSFLSLVLLLGLSVTLPWTAVLFLGYLVFSAGEVARKGWRGALPGLSKAGHLGGLGLVAGVAWIPVWLLQSSAVDAKILTPDSTSVTGLQRLADIALGVWLFQLLVVVLRGGKKWYFLRPLSNVWWILTGLVRPTWYVERWRDGSEWCKSLGVFEILSLGVRAFVGTIGWLIIPSLMIGLGPRVPIIGLVGVVLLAWCVLHLPVMQIRLALEERMGVFAEVSASRELRRRAPVAMLLAMLVWVLTSTPLYLLLIEPFAWGLLWLPGIFFAFFLVLGRWAWGWAVGRGRVKSARANWLVRVICWWLSFLLGLLYAGAVFLSPYLLFRGRWGLIEHHALLFPVLGP
jgi:hypothetical protein